jgi:hypothetical protein
MEMIKFKFTVTEVATGKTYCEYEEFATHFEANSYGLAQSKGAKAHGVAVTWCKL